MILQNFLLVFFHFHFHDAYSIGFDGDFYRGGGGGGDDMQGVEGMLRHDDATLDGLVGKVDNDEEQLAVGCLAQEGVGGVGVEVLRCRIGIHEVEELAVGYSRMAGHAQEIGVGLFELALVGSQVPAVEEGAMQRVESPIVEDGGAAVESAKALGLHARLAESLSGIVHIGVCSQEQGNGYCGQCPTWIACKEVGGNALLVVVLEEVEHVVANVVGLLPLAGDVGGGAAVANDVAQAVVHSHFVVEQVEASSEVFAIECRIVDLGNE